MRARGLGERWVSDVIHPKAVGSLPRGKWRSVRNVATFSVVLLEANTQLFAAHFPRLLLCLDILLIL